MNTVQRWFFFNDDKKGHDKALDGLRGIAVMMVLLSHTSNHDMLFHPSLAFNGIGKGGVYLFYVLSAYLLDRQISFSLMNGTADSFFWKRYFLRRVLRIYPLFLVALFVFFGITCLGIRTDIASMSDISRHFFLLDGKGVFWSVPVEFKYYILSPFILLVCHFFLKWNLRYIGLFFLLLSITTLTVDFYFHLDKTSTFKFLTVFLAGTLLAIYHLKIRINRMVSHWPKVIGFAGLIALFLCFIMNPNYVGDWMGIDTSNNGRKVLIAYTLLCGVMLFAALYTNGIFRKFLEMRFLRFIGIISFSLYLFHMPVIYFMDSGIIALPKWLMIYFFFGLTFFISAITFLCIERPLSLIRISRPVIVKPAA